MKKLAALFLVFLILNSANAKRNCANDEQNNDDTSLWPALAWGIGAAVAVGLGGPIGLAAVGYTSAGITAGSMGAAMMSTAAVANGGGVVAGGLVAGLQAAGAIGSVGYVAPAVAGVVAAGTKALIDA